jgi:hypothetical protein
LHPTELRVLRNYFGGGASISPVSLGDSSKGIVSCLMARNYDDVECATEGRYSLHILNAGGARYSGFHAGSGEDIACLISRVLNRLPDKSLLVIEEIETGLHPAAQRQLIGKLLELCWKKKLQVICSSHSQSVLEAVPADARVLLVRYGASVQPLYGISVAEAVSDMTELPTTEICVYVEDEVARSLVLETLAAETRKRVRVVSCGSWDDVIRFLAVFRRDPSLGNALGILDGDRRGRESEHRDSLAKYMGGNANEEDWSWLTERLLFLPGTVAPEVLFHRLGQEQDFRNRLSNELNAGVTMIDGFFSSFVNADPHNLPYELSQRVGLGAERVLIGLARATCAHKDTDFQAIEEFVRHRIDTGAP